MVQIKTVQLNTDVNDSFKNSEKSREYVFYIDFLKAIMKSRTYLSFHS